MSGLCRGSPPNCYCDASCHNFGDCCSDIDNICSLFDFIQRPQNLITIQSEEAQFQCSVTVTATFEWSYIPMDGSNPVLIADEVGTLQGPKYSVVIGNTYSTVTVHNVQPMDQGQYTCSASSIFGNISATAALTVWGMFDNCNIYAKLYYHNYYSVCSTANTASSYRKLCCYGARYTVASLHIQRIPATNDHLGKENW